MCSRTKEEHDVEPTIPESNEPGTGRTGAALMPIEPEEAHRLLPRVDPGRVRSGQAVGLRDGAVLALLAAGLRVAEISALRARNVKMVGGRAVVEIEHEVSTWSRVLPTDMAARVVVWLTEAEIWGRDEPVFRGCRGPLTAMGIFKIVERYRNPKPARQRARKPQETRPAVQLPPRLFLLAHWQAVAQAGAPTESRAPRDPSVRADRSRSASRTGC